ncbi:unnamed protein product [Mucor circinelloides]
MWTLIKAVFYLSIFTFGFVNFTGSEPSVANDEPFSFLELTKQGLKWRAREHDKNLRADQQPCTYEVKLESKFKDIKKPLPFNRDFFDTSNMDLSVTAECPEIVLPEESLKDMQDLLLNYDDLTYTQKVVVDYRIKTGYYKPIVIEKTKLPYAEISSTASQYGKIANLMFLLNRIASLLFAKYIVRSRHAADEQ